MRLEAKRTDLVSVLAAIEPIVPRKPVRPDYGYCQVRWETRDRAQITATNGDIRITIGLDCEIDGPKATLPVHQLSQYLRALRGETVTIDVDDAKSRFTVSSNGDRYSGGLLATDSIFDIPITEEAKTLARINCAQFLQMLARTAFCCDPDGTRYALGGVCLSVTKGRLTAAATDTRRLAVSYRQAACETDWTVAQTPCLLPKAACQLIAKALEDTPQELEVGWNSRACSINLPGAVRIEAKQLEGRFPDFDKIVQPWAAFTVTCSMLVSEWKNAVESALVLTDAETRGVRFRITDGELSIEGRSQTGEGLARFPAETSGDGVISLDPAFVGHFLSTVGPQWAVNMAMIDAESAAQFRIQSEDADTYVVMPMSTEVR